MALAEQEPLRIRKEAAVSRLAAILDGVEGALELERELGVRTVDLTAPLETAKVAVAKSTVARSEVAKSVAAAPTPEPKPAPAAKAATLVFLSDRALSQKAAAMIAKAVAALGFGAEAAPVVWEGRPPAAKAYVALGHAALKKWAPGRTAAMGQWTKTAGGRDVLLVNSPEAIVRFPVVTPAVEQMKKELWRGLKAAKERALQ